MSQDNNDTAAAAGRRGNVNLPGASVSLRSREAPTLRRDKSIGVSGTLLEIAASGFSRIYLVC